MHAFVAAGSAFLMAVLWFDLMFDVQVRGHAGPALPPEILDSIAAYYRRVTTEARPMGQLVGAVMLYTLSAIAIELARGDRPLWRAALCLALAGGAIGLALGRTVRNAVRLGAGQGAPARRAQLARQIYHDHLYCLAAMTTVTALQLFTP
jgi:hypothetical protein